MNGLAYDANFLLLLVLPLLPVLFVALVYVFWSVIRWLSNLF